MLFFFRLQPSTKHSPSLILCAKYLIFGMSMIKSVLWQTLKESNLPRRLRVSKLKLLIAEQWKENIEFAMWQEDQLKCKVSKNILHFYNNEPSKNKHYPIFLSSLARYSQEPRLKRIFEILWVLFEIISVFFSDWPKCWILRTLGNIRDIFCKCHLHNASKEVFWAKHAQVQLCHFDNFSILAKWHLWIAA